MTAQKTYEPSGRWLQSLSLKEVEQLIQYHKGLMMHIPISKQAYCELQGELGRRELIGMGIIPKGTLVRIKPEFRDGPEDSGEYITRTDSSKGRVDISATEDFKFTIVPVETVEVSMLEVVCAS